LKGFFGCFYVIAGDIGVKEFHFNHNPDVMLVSVMVLDCNTLGVLTFPSDLAAAALFTASGHYADIAIASHFRL
jgi:hypothetical protein